MTLNDFRKNYDEIRVLLAQTKSPLLTKLLYSQLDYTLIQINVMLNAAPENIR